MNTLILIIGTLSLIDLLATPMLLSVIRKSGGFHYLVTTLHKSLFMVLVLVAGIVMMGNGTLDVISQIAFCASFLFLFNMTFEINDFFFKTFDGSKYSLDGMTDQGKQMMSEVFVDMEKGNEKSTSVRFGEMVSNFVTNISQDFSVVSMVLTNDKPMKEAFNELHKVLGNDIKFSGMTKKELFFMVKNRVLIDGVVLLLVGLVFFV
jgi:hypothetical protein